MINNVVQGDRNHDRAMELTTLAKFLTGYEPFDPIGHDIERIAAELETEAAENQSEQNELWKSVLYRSAGWMYLNAANGNTRLNENAKLCAIKGTRHTRQNLPVRTPPSPEHSRTTPEGRLHPTRT